MDVPVPAPLNTFPSSYIAPEDILTLEWPSECTNNNNSLIQSTPRTITHGRSRSSSCSSSSSSESSSFSEEIPRIIQQPLTPSTPLYPTSPAILPVGRQPDELTRKLMIDTFINIGRLSHFYRVLSYFPSFMEKYQLSYNSIVRHQSGPLHVRWRLYIGMMAASQHKCQYVVSKLTDEFILAGGNIDWLQGLEHAPVKIRNLATLNTILAHQPWRLKASHIGALARGAPNPHDNWKINEIVHAIVILSTFHSLSSYVLGCGIVPEYDSIGGNYEQPLTEEPGSSIGIMSPLERSDMASGLGVSLFQERSNDSEENTVEPAKPITIQNKSTPTRSDDVESMKHTNKLIERLKKKRELQISTFNNEDTHYGSVSSDSSLRVDFENIEEETFTDDDDPPSPFPFFDEFFSTSATDSHILAFNPSPTNEYFSRFLDKNIETPYEDFDVKSSEYTVFKLGDYCWETQGVVMVNSYLPSIDDSLGIGEFLDREFSEIRDLTDYRLFQYKSSNIDLDTRPLRQAVWFYVQRLFGLLKDDYEYRDLNKFLNIKIKKFLKKVCCKPEEIEYKDWRNIGFHLREEEKCHVNLIAVEARKQAELVYGLWSVMKWENER